MTNKPNIARSRDTKRSANALDEGDRLIPDASAARALGVSLMTLWRWTGRGLLPVVQINGRNYRRVGHVQSLQRTGTVTVSKEGGP